MGTTQKALVISVRSKPVSETQYGMSAISVNT